MKYLSMLAIIFITFSSNSTVYKWTDANGRIHYSDFPPEKQIDKNNAEQIKVAGTPHTRQGNVENESSPNKNDIDCVSAVKYSKESIESQTKIGRDNLKSEGFRSSETRVRLQEKILARMNNAASKISISACRSAKDQEKQFYQCMEKGYAPIGACLKRYSI